MARYAQGAKERDPLQDLVARMVAMVNELPLPVRGLPPPALLLL